MTASKTKSKHPNHQQLDAFLHGMLNQSQRLAVEKHVERCGRCADALESVAGDTLSNRLKHVATHFENLVAAHSDDGIPDELKNHARYEIIEKIGSGGMGEVYRARQTSMDRTVAIKVLRRHLFQNDRAVARFHNEVKVAARLNHPNIVHSYDAEVTSGLNILVMELVDGRKLSEVVSLENPMPTAIAAQVGFEIAEGLKYAHAQGMIHRDIKPQNVMLLPDHSVKITDFGLAKFVLESTEDKQGSLTIEGETFGTPDYIAPEQIRDSSSADARSDIYSLGCTLYFMLTGRPPFLESSIGEKLAGHLEKAPDSLGQLRPDIPVGLVAAVERMMNKDSSQRFENHGQVMSVLAPFAKQVDQYASAGEAGFAAAASIAETSLDLEPPTQVFKGPNSGGRPFRLGHRVVFGAFALVTLLMISGILPILLGVFSTDNQPVKIAMVVPSEEAWYPEIKAFQEFFNSKPGVVVEIIAEKRGQVRFNRQFEDANLENGSIQKVLAEVLPEDFDGVVFTGSWNGETPYSTRYAFDERLNQEARQFMEAMLRDNKPVGSICTGTAVLAKAGILRGKHVASCRYLCDELKAESEGIWSEVPDNDRLSETVVDGLIVTGGSSVNCAEVAKEMLEIIDR